VASVWARVNASDLPDGGSVPIKFTEKENCTSLHGTSGFYNSITSGTLTGEWTELSGTFTYPECPDLTELTLYLEEPADPAMLIDIYVDDASVMLAQ
jgi:hypothetical protein